MDCFETLTGFRETNYDDTRAKLSVSVAADVASLPKDAQRESLAKCDPKLISGSCGIATGRKNKSPARRDDRNAQGA